MRLINAEVLKEAIKKELPAMSNWGEHFIPMLIDNAPTIEERPQGEWIKTITGHYSNYYKCSICGRTINCTLKGLEHYPFCHCGADMRGEEK